MKTFAPARWALALAAFLPVSTFATTATSLASFGGIEEPARIYYPATNTFVADSYPNITDLGGGVIQMQLRYNYPNPGWWDGDRTTSNTDRGRAEIKTLGPHQMIHETYEYATTWRTNPEFVGSGAFCHITQLKSVDGLEGSSGAPMVTTSIFSGTRSAAIRYASTSFSPLNVFSPRVVRNITWAPAAWTSQVIRVRTTADGEATGFVLASLGGDAFQGVTGVEVCRPSSTEYYPKWGLYRGTSTTSNFSPGDYIQHSNISNNKTAGPTLDPVFSPATGTYSPLPTVTITSATPGASIRYTINGSTPSDTVGTLYTGPITLSGTTTINAIAYAPDLVNSFVTTATYTLGVLPPTYEAETIPSTPVGATKAVQTDVNTSGGQWMLLNSNAAGQYIEYKLQGVAPGVYTLKMNYKTNNNRGIMQFALDGTNYLAPVDQYRPTSPAPSSIYPLVTFGVVTFTTTGDHTVRLTCVGKNAASSGFGISADRFFLDPVPDTTAPVLSLPANIVVEATDSDGAVVNFSASATDDRDGVVPVTLTPASGIEFPLGVTAVSASAHDATGNIATGSFTVTVRDTTAPVITSLTPSLTTLSPANHQMVAVTIAADVFDTIDDSPTVKIVSVASNEPVSGTGDGDLAPDWEITDDLALNLRAESAGTGSGRVYTITVEARDASGNTATGTVTVTVTNNTAQSYSSWASDNGLSGPNTAFAADPDGDGIANLLEYFLGLRPTISDPIGQPTGTVESGQLVFRFNRARGITATTYRVTTSSDLISWSPVVPDPVLESSTTLTETFTATSPMSSLQLFVRLEVTSGGITVNTAPVGYLKTTLASAATSAFGIPLDDVTPPAAGIRAGKIESFTATTLTNSAGGWTGNLANAVAPWSLRLTSGPSAGKLLDVTANTATTLTVSGADLTTLGLTAGTDTFELVPIDTLGTLFGSTTLQGGTSASTADNVQVRSGATWAAYYYDTTLGFWRRTLGPAANSNNVLIRPATGVQILRRGPALTLVFLGRAPATTFRTPILNASGTVIHAGFPTDTTLGTLALQTLLPGWHSGTGANADSLALLNGTAWVSYFYNGSFWQNSAAANSDAQPIPAGALLQLQRTGTTPGTTDLVRLLPYSL